MLTHNVRALQTKRETDGQINGKVISIAESLLGYVIPYVSLSNDRGDWDWRDAYAHSVIRVLTYYLTTAMSIYVCAVFYCLRFIF